MVLGLNSDNFSALFEIKLLLSIDVVFNSEYIAPPHLDAKLSWNMESLIIMSAYDVYTAPPLTDAELFVKLLFIMVMLPFRCNIAPPNSDLQFMKPELIMLTLPPIIPSLNGADPISVNIAPPFFSLETLLNIEFLTTT